MRRVGTLTTAQVNGVDYQPGGSDKFKAGSDPLSDRDTCARDIYLMQQLGINTVRVYSVDPSISHDECMTLLASAGIYLILDVNTPLPNQSLNRDEPWTTYNPEYLEHIFSVVDVFAGYDNMLGFLAGNEVVFDTTSAKTSPNYVKAVVRDLKAYLSNHVSRVIPVGYSNADSLEFRTSMAAYLQCGDSGYIDFWGVNSYQWCGHNTFEGSGYSTLVDSYDNYSLPIIFTEYGCNVNPPRLFEETVAIYSDKMTGTFDGGLVYEWTQEANKYGLVSIGDDGSAETNNDFTTLQKQLVSAKPASATIPSDAKTNPRPTSCPSSTDAMFADIFANMTLPTTLGADLIKNGVKNITRGAFVKNVKTNTKYSIKMNGKSVSSPSIKATETTDEAPLASGGSGIENGGKMDSSSGSSGSSDSSSSGGSNTTKTGAAMALAPNGSSGLAMLVVVALGFGMFL